MIYSSFSSDIIATKIATLCLSILIKTNQSWRTVYTLLSLPEEKVLALFNVKEKTKRGSYEDSLLPDIHFQEILNIDNKDIKDAEQLLEDVYIKGWNIAFFNSGFYPASWRYLKKQAPPLIFFKGMCKNNNVGVSVVGTTKPDEKCAEITKECVEFITQWGGYVISGGARGVDQIAHDIAIQSGGSTQAILPCGIFHYPIPSHWEEAIKCNKMQIISPWLPSAQWASQQAVRRNLFIAFLAQIGCILQPSHEGGSLRVARNILSRNLPVLVYKPESYAKMLKHLPQIFPLTNSDGKLNYPILKLAMEKVKSLKEGDVRDLFD